MANRSKDRRARSRKRRPAGAQPAQQGPQGQQGQQRAADKGAAPDKGARVDKGAGGAKSRDRAKTGKPGKPGLPNAPTYGERPRAPWHPLPLSELLILVGAIVAVFGFRRLNHEGSSGAATLIAGLAALAIGTLEVSLREHRSGYRSHTVMLALLPVLIVDSLIVLVVSLFTTAPRTLSIGLLALDIVIFIFLFRMLRARFLDARHARVLREG